MSFGLMAQESIPPLPSIQYDMNAALKDNTHSLKSRERYKKKTAIESKIGMTVVLDVEPNLATEETKNQALTLMEPDRDGTKCQRDSPLCSTSWPFTKMSWRATEEEPECHSTWGNTHSSKGSMYKEGGFKQAGKLWGCHIITTNKHPLLQVLSHIVYHFWAENINPLNHKMKKKYRKHPISTYIYKFIDKENNH